MRLSVGRALIFGQNDIWVYGNFLSRKNGNKLGGYTDQDTYDYKGLNAALSGLISNILNYRKLKHLKLFIYKF